MTGPAVFRRHVAAREAQADELLLEVPKDEVSDLAAMVKTEMENVEQLTVPLVVDVKKGPNWRDMDVI